MSLKYNGTCVALCYNITYIIKSFLTVLLSRHAHHGLDSNKKMEAIILNSACSID